MNRVLLKDGMKVRAPKEGSGITAGKEYVIYDACDLGKASFRINNDDGVSLFCLVKNCSHLRNSIFDGPSDWEILEQGIEYDKRQENYTAIFEGSINANTAPFGYPKRGLISERGVMIFAWIMLLLIAGAITYFAFV
jgi:hypothetical protein